MRSLKIQEYNFNRSLFGSFLHIGFKQVKLHLRTVIDLSISSEVEQVLDCIIAISQTRHDSYVW